MSRNYNFIYSKLVEDETDFVGQIAYSLYKQHKIEHIEKYKTDNGKEISEEELSTFHEMSCNDIVLDAYRRKAEDILGDFINDTLRETIEEFREDIIKSQAQILEEIIDPIKPASKTKQFWTRILQSVIANLTLSAIIALVILILYVAKVGFLRTVANIYNVEIITGSDKQNLKSPPIDTLKTD